MPISGWMRKLSRGHCERCTEALTAREEALRDVRQAVRCEEVRAVQARRLLLEGVPA